MQQKGRMWVWALGRVETVGLKGDIMTNMKLLEPAPANSSSFRYIPELHVKAARCSFWKETDFEQTE